MKRAAEGGADPVLNRFRVPWEFVDDGLGLIGWRQPPPDESCPIPDIVGLRVEKYHVKEGNVWVQLTPAILVALANLLLTPEERASLDGVTAEPPISKGSQ